MKDEYVRLAELNEGARELAADTGAPGAFRSTTCRRTTSRRKSIAFGVRSSCSTTPCTATRAKRREVRRPVVPLDQLIRADLLGNMGAGLENDEIAAPSRSTSTMTSTCSAKNTTPSRWCRYGERFFQSLGLAASSWRCPDASMLVQPKDQRGLPRERLGHDREDLRIKMCIEPTREDFVTIHRELATADVPARSWAAVPVPGQRQRAVDHAGVLRSRWSIRC